MDAWEALVCTWQMKFCLFMKNTTHFNKKDRVVSFIVFFKVTERDDELRPHKHWVFFARGACTNATVSSL